MNCDFAGSGQLTGHYRQKPDCVPPELFYSSEPACPFGFWRRAIYCNELIGFTQPFDKLVFVGLSPEWTVDSGQWTVKESLRDNFKYSVQKYCDFSEYLPIIIITIFSNNPRRGYHNCQLSTVNCPLERSDKHQFVALLSQVDKHLL